MSRRAYPAVYDPNSAGTAPAASKKRKQTVGIPQGQTNRTPAKPAVPKPGNNVPTNRQLYREAVASRTGNGQSPAVRPSVRLADRTAQHSKTAKRNRWFYRIPYREEGIPELPGSRMGAGQAPRILTP